MKIPYGEILKYREQVPNIYRLPIFNHEFPLIMSRMGNGYRILDFGCGDGKIYNELLLPAGLDIEYTGLDIDPTLQNRVNFPIHESLDDFENAGYRKRHFDGLLMLNIMEHLPLKDGYETLVRLNPYIDGDIFIMTPNPRCLDYLFADPEHITFYEHTFLYGLLKHLDFGRIEIWRGKGLHRNRQIAYEKSKNEEYLRQNKLQQEVCTALGLDWYGNILIMGDRYNEEDSPA